MLKKNKNIKDEQHRWILLHVHACQPQKWKVTIKSNVNELTFMIHGHSCVIVDSVKAPVLFLDHPEHICRRYALRGNTVQSQGFSKHRIHCSVWFHFKILASKWCKQQIILKTIHSDCHTEKTVYTQQIICIHPANITHSKHILLQLCGRNSPPKNLSQRWSHKHWSLYTHISLSIQ